MQTAPWSQKLVDELNAHQQNGMVHPYTCANRNDGKHLDGGEGVLVATVDGWKCPYCDYRQKWCH